jgi:hypothetical protein
MSNDPRITCKSISLAPSQWIKRMMNSGPGEMVIWLVVVLECWICSRALGAKGKTAVEFFRLLSHNRLSQWPNVPRITCKSISPAPSQWIKRMMKSSCPDEVAIRSLVVVESWICGPDLGLKQLSFSQSSLSMTK